MKKILTIYGLNPIELVNIALLLIPFIFMILCIIGILFINVKRNKEFNNYCKWIMSDWNKQFKNK
jgi:hypothetical protein